MTTSAKLSALLFLKMRVMKSLLFLIIAKLPLICACKYVHQATLAGRPTPVPKSSDRIQDSRVHRVAKDIFLDYPPLETTKSTKLPFDNYELENVAIINKQLGTSLEFRKSGYWNDRVQRYLFYSLALETMKKPLAKPDSFENQMTNNSIDVQQSSKWLNLGFFTLMSQSASHKLRSIAKEAEYHIKEYGRWKVGSGSISTVAGILGTLGLILTPVGGVLLTGVAFGLGLASGVTDIIGNANYHMPDYYARMANNQMQMVQNQGKFLTQFLNKTLEVLHEEAGNLNETEMKDVEKFLQLYEIYDFLHMADQQAAHEQKARQGIKWTQTSSNLIFALLFEASRLAVMEDFEFKKFENAISTAIENPSPENIKSLEKYIDHVFPSELEEEKFLRVFSRKNSMNNNNNVDAVPKGWVKKARHNVIMYLLEHKEKAKNIAKSKLDASAWRLKFPSWAKSIGKSIFPSNILNSAGKVSKVVKPLLVFADGGLNLLALGFGMFDIVTGAQCIQSSGVITHKLKEHADIIDSNLFGLLSAYENITNVNSEDMLKNTFQNVDVLTGINLHACDRNYAGTSYGIYAGLKSHENKHQCITKDMMELQDISAGQWKHYDGAILGNCSHFFLRRDGGFELNLENTGTDAVCLKDLNLQTNFDPAPKYSCQVHENGVWLDSAYYGNSPVLGYTNNIDMKCHVIPGISLLKITSAGEESNQNMVLTFIFGNGKHCSTQVLVKGNHETIVQADALGQCFQLEVDESDLRMSSNRRGQKNIVVDIIKVGDETIRISAIEFFVNLRNVSEKFICELPSKGIKVSKFRAGVYCFQRDESFNSRSIFALQIHPKVDAHLLVFEICSGQRERCCATSAFFNVKNGQKVIYEGAMLRNCEGFEITDDAYTVHVKMDDDGYDGYVADVLDTMTIYSSRFKLLTPMHTCSMNTSERYVDCVIPTQFQINGFLFGFCDEDHDRENSSISVSICSDGQCCDTGPLIKAYNDSEPYFKVNKHGCQGFQLSTKTLKVYVENSGKDPLCLNQLQLQSDRKILNCYLPLEEEFWSHSSKMLMLTCD